MKTPLRKTLALAAAAFDHLSTAERFRWRYVHISLVVLDLIETHERQNAILFFFTSLEAISRGQLEIAAEYTSALIQAIRRADMYALRLTLLGKACDERRYNELQVTSDLCLMCAGSGLRRSDDGEFYVCPAVQEGKGPSCPYQKSQNPTT